jgi:DNA polymerase III delta prime subunit
MKNIWWEKHRPDSLDDFVGQEHLRNEMRSIIEGKAPMQHFIFYSNSAGTGKTTLANILAEGLGYNMHIFNASSKRTRGIEFVEEELIHLSQSGYAQTIILLDEADQLTPAAQSALKGVIETSDAYFILTCNDLSKVSQWLQSRCQVRTFEPHSEQDMFDALCAIADHEGYAVDGEINYICKIHTGDLRNAIGALQTVCHMESEQATKFLQSLGEDFDARRYLRLASTEKSIADAVKLSGNNDMRKVVRKVFDYATNSPATSDAIRKVIEAAIISERDLVNGVSEAIVRWDFPRMLGE